MNTGNETTIYTQDHFLKAASVSKQFLDAGWGEGSGRWRLLATRRELTDGPIEASPKALTEAHVRLESQLTNTLTLSLSLSLSLSCLCILPRVGLCVHTMCIIYSKYGT